MYQIGCNGGGGGGSGGTATGTGTGTGPGTATVAATGASCVFDPWDPNDTPATATSLDGMLGTAVEGLDAPLRRSATLCAEGDEEDHDTFTLSAAAYVGLEVTFAEDGQSLAIKLYAGGTEPLLRSKEGADLRMAHLRLEAGVYRVRLRRVEGDPAYRLRVYALSERADPPAPGALPRPLCPRYDLDGGDTDQDTGAHGTESDADRWRPHRLPVRVRSADGATVLPGWATTTCGWTCRRHHRRTSRTTVRAT